eukprot:149886_1
MYDIEDSKYKSKMTGKTNLIREKVLDVFENVKTITVKCDGYALSMLDLLILIDSFGIERTILITSSGHMRTKENDWMNHMIASAEWENRIKPKYKQKKYQIIASKQPICRDSINHYQCITINKL